MRLLNKRILLKAVDVQEENWSNPAMKIDHYEVVEIAEGITQVKKGDKVMFFQASTVNIEGKEYRLCEEDDLTVILD